MRNGELIGLVRAIIKTEERKIGGLLIASLGGELCRIDTDGIIRMGRDSVLVDEGKVEQVGELAGVEVTPPVGKDNNETLVMTTAGESLGVIEDVVIEEKDGSVLGYEISDGYIMDMLRGRKVVPVSEVLKYGKDAVIVSDEYEGDLP